MPELGIYEPCNGFLSYRFSDSPLEGFEEGGDISFNGGEILTDAAGNGIMTYRWGNNHGSVMQANGQWYVFYHRQTGQDEFSRQAMLEPIDAAIGKDGRIYLGKIDYRDGEPVVSRPVEMTSQGPQVNGLDAREWISAGYACHLHGGKEKAWIAPVYEQQDDVSAPVMNISDGTAVGFRYLQFGLNTPKRITVLLEATGKGKVSVRLDTPGGREIACITLEGGKAEAEQPLLGGVIGKHALYFVFRLENNARAVLDRFTLDD